MSALMHAVAFGNDDIVDLLLSAPNIDVNIRNNNRLTALGLAQRNNRNDIASRLRQRSATRWQCSFSLFAFGYFQPRRKRKSAAPTFCLVSFSILV